MRQHNMVAVRSASRSQSLTVTLPEQTGERVRGGAVSAAVAASTAPRRSAPGGGGLAPAG